jgi:hypothetical protein
LIGTSPNVLKLSTTSVTNASGSSILPNMEWDTYTLALASSSYDLLGTMPFSPLTINPSSAVSFRFVLAPKIPKSLLVAVMDVASGTGISGASVNLSSGAYSQTLKTGQSAWTDTDWSNGAYASQSGGIDADSLPGTFMLLENASSSYTTSTVSWLISNTIDFGSTSTNYFSFNVNPVAEPTSTGPASAAFQLAANNDNAIWNFAGPGGTSGDYYTASSTIVGLNGNRYLRYKVFLSTQDPGTSPQVNDVTIAFSSPCVPPAQVLFSNLLSGTYLANVTASNYIAATSSVTISASTQSLQVSLIHQ